LEIEIHNLERNRDRAAEKYIETDDEAFDRTRIKYSQKIKEFEYSTGKIDEDIQKIEESSLIVRNADELVDMVQEQYGNLDNLDLPDKIGIIDKIYDTGSITFYPKWWLEEHKDTKEILPIAGPDFGQTVYEFEKGMLLLNGWIDLDYHTGEARDPDYLYRNHSER
jgi:hypothetical protein